MRQPERAFWRNKRVLVTGHSGFKGAWLVLMLEALGAKVSGLALPPEDGPNAYELLAIERRLEAEALIDIRDYAALKPVIDAMQPDLVLHLAAQALVSRSYADPIGTFDTNVTGTLNLLLALRGARAQAALCVTTDKVYANDNSGRPFRENDPLGGHDPYSASKAACEIAVQSFRHSFSDLPLVATARAGNVVGGGDFGADRLVPDIVRAATSGASVEIRAPDSTRPFQHVLDVLRGYLLLVEDMLKGQAPYAVNFGPDSALSVRAVLSEAQAAGFLNKGWHPPPEQRFGEAKALCLDSTLAHESLQWRPNFSGQAVFIETFTWYRHWMAGTDMAALSELMVKAALK